MFNTTQHSTAPITECVIRVKSGDLAPKGKGHLTIGVESDGKVSLNATLPSVTGVPTPFDFTSLERLELVSTRSGGYQGKQWMGPAAATAAAFVAVPLITTPLISPGLSVTLGDRLIYAAFVGSPYAAGIYAGSKLTRMVRFVAVTSDGKHCVAEMPEAAFRFIQGIKAADKLHIDTVAADPVLDPEDAAVAPAPA